MKNKPNEPIFESSQTSPVSNNEAEKTKPVFEGDQADAKVISIFSSAHSLGSSIYALELASFIALNLKDKGKKVCLVDTDVLRGDVGKHANRFHPNISALANGVVTMDSIKRSAPYAEHLNLYLLLSPVRQEELDSIKNIEQLYEDTLKHLLKMHDYIIIHSSGLAYPALVGVERLMELSDATVVTFDLSESHTLNTKRLLDQKFSKNASVHLIALEAENDISFEGAKKQLLPYEVIGKRLDMSEWTRGYSMPPLTSTLGFRPAEQEFAAVAYALTGESAFTPEKWPDSAEKLSLLARLKRFLNK